MQWQGTQSTMILFYLFIFVIFFPPTEPIKPHFSFLFRFLTGFVSCIVNDLLVTFRAIDISTLQLQIEQNIKKGYVRYDLLC